MKKITYKQAIDLLDFIQDKFGTELSSKELLDEFLEDSPSKIDMVYVAMLQDCDGEYDLIGVNEDKHALETLVKDYFGISETHTYSKPSKYLGYVGINYSEHEDPMQGYYTFSDEDGEYKVYIYYLPLNEPI